MWWLSWYFFCSFTTLTCLWKNAIVFIYFMGIPNRFCRIFIYLSSFNNFLLTSISLFKQSIYFGKIVNSILVESPTRKFTSHIPQFGTFVFRMKLSCNILQISLSGAMSSIHRTINQMSRNTFEHKTYYHMNIFVKLINIDLIITVNMAKC